MTDQANGVPLDRRAFTRAAAAAALTAGFGGEALAQTRPDGFAALRDKPVRIGMLIFPQMDQIDFTGPFEVLVRTPNATVEVVGSERGPFRDHKGLLLTPDKAIGAAGTYDLLVVTGGPGQQALMEDEPVLSLIRDQIAAGRLVFSVCTGALLCGAAGVLKGRRATTHWAAFDLLPYFGATPVDQRVVVDGPLVTAAGVTAGIDGAFKVVSLLRGDAAAQQIQLDIQYAPEPPFDAGTPRTAPRAVIQAVSARYKPLTDARLLTARRVAARLGLTG
jgi:cyclohexyl-isocyanide hydratase